jgi:CubicO group peptidase (beta-lactamase class C family)
MKFLRLMTMLPLAWLFTFVAPAQSLNSSAIDGDWQGTLTAGPQTLRLAIHFHSTPGGEIEGTMDSLDQGSNGIALSMVKLKDKRLSFNVPAVQGNYTGTLSADGNRLSGTWVQSMPLTLNLERKAASAPAQAEQAARAPVPLDQLGAALADDLKPVLAKYPKTGLVVGIVDHSHRQIFAFGTARADSIFEIGSVTKTFTGLALAQMVVQQKAKLDEPVRALLPPGTVDAPTQGPEITLVDLATQHSGLPRLPNNFKPATMMDPYVDYRASDLYKYLAKRGAGRPEKTDFAYSNLGFGLLGQALAVRAGSSYEDLIQRQIVEPLGMKDTGMSFNPEQLPRFIQGYQGSWDPAQPWHFDALAGAGSLHSTAADMLTYCEAQLHPDKLPAGAPGTPAGTLAAALALDHELRADGPGSFRIALAWLFQPATGTYYHDGGTGGFNSFVSFNPGADRAIVVLYNRLDLASGQGLFAERVAAHAIALLDGKPAAALGD